MQQGITAIFQGSWLFIVLAFLSGVAQGSAANSVNWADATQAFQKENHWITGKFNGVDQWPGRLCQGHYEYDVTLGAEFTNLDFVLNDNGSLSVYAELRDLYAVTEGTYRSQATLCIPLHGWKGIGVDRAQLFFEATFEGKAEDMTDVRIKVVATKLGTLHLGSAVPAWFERFLTGLLNRALVNIWTSRVGEWLSGQISAIIKKKIPVATLDLMQPGSYRR